MNQSHTENIDAKSSRVERLLAVVEADHAVELTILYNAKISALNALNKESVKTRASIEAYRVANKALVELADPLEAEFFPKEAPARTWKSRIKAYKYLIDSGYKIGKSKLYKDAAGGLLALEPDGSVTEKSLKRYLKLSGLKKLSEIAEKGGPDRDTIAVKRQSEDLEKIKEQVKMLRIERGIKEGKYIPRDEFYLELAGRLVVLETGLKEAFQRVDWIIEAVGGDQNRAPELSGKANDIIDGILKSFAEFGGFEVEVVGLKIDD